MKVAGILVLFPLLLAGCGLLGPSTPRKVEGDTNGVAIKGGSDTDIRELAAAHCGSFNKSALLLAQAPEDRRADIVRFACR